jgi:hypothetical protein
MDCFVSNWEQGQRQAFEDAVQDAALPPLKKNSRKGLALVVALVCSAVPALAVAAANGYFEDPPAPWVEPVAPPIVKAQIVKRQHQPAQTVPVTVSAQIPKRVVYTGPRTCKTRNLELYGSKVRVCARPATPITHQERPASLLANRYR